MRIVTVLFFTLFFGVLATHAQKSIVAEIQRYVLAHPDKPVIAIMDLQWCPGIKRNEAANLALLSKVSACYHIIIVSSDIQKSYFTAGYRDTFINVKDFYRNDMFKKQMKKEAIMGSDLYQQKINFWDFSPSNFMIFKDGKFATFINTLFPTDSIQKYQCK